MGAYMSGDVYRFPCRSMTFYVRNHLCPLSATLAMGLIEGRLGSVVEKLSDQNYEQSLALYCLWFDIGLTYCQITPQDQVFNDTLKIFNKGSAAVSPKDGKLFHPTVHLVIRFASDAESDRTLAPHSPGLQSRLCARNLQWFFEINAGCGCSPHDSWVNTLISRANLIAAWANLGYVEESAIRSHILQPLISEPFPKLQDYNADGIIVLFKIAGATFGAYVDPSVVDRCFELLKNHYSLNTVKGRLVQVRVAHIVEGGNRVDENFKELLELRERGWEGLPPPPVFATRMPNVTGVGQEDPSATPVATPLGLPASDPEPQLPHSPPPKSATFPETEKTPSPPATHSPSISITTLSDFEVADILDDEIPTDPTTVTPHDTLNFEDGNVEVLCGNTLFRVHTSILSLHSPALRQMFAQASLVTAESPNGCPRIPSFDKATDFAMLLKTVYLPGYVRSSLPRPIVYRAVTDSPNGTKYRTSTHSRPSSESPRSTTCRLLDPSCSRPSVMRTQRLSRESLLPSHWGKASSVGRPLTRMRSSTYSFSRISRPRCQWRIIWRLEEALIH